MSATPEVDALERTVTRFLVPLRTGDGLDDLALGDLSSALRNCAAAWQGRDMIPKRAASILAELFPAVEGCAAHYDQDYARRILDSCIALHDLVVACTTEPAVETDDESGTSAAVRGDDGLADGMHVVIRLRHDFTVTNARQLLSAAQNAYVLDNQGVTQNDAAEAVTSVSDVIFTLLEQDGILGAGAEAQLASHAGDGLRTDGWRAQVSINEPMQLSAGWDCFDQGDVFALPPPERP